MWRDRTNLYISYRQSYTHHPHKQTRLGTNGFSASADDERKGLMSPGAFDEGDVVIEMDLLPPRWVDIQDEVTDILKTITQKSADLDKLHSKHVLPGFDDDKVKKQEEAMIEDLTRDITRAFHECKKAIGRIDFMVKDSKASGGVSKGDETMAKNIQISLASKVQEVSSVFRKKQSNYLKKLRALEGMNSPLERSFTPQNPYTDPSMLESEADKSFAQTALQQSAQKMLQGNETVIAQREREINDIARGITELAEIFKDLQMMVIDQGTILDSVAYNIEKMATDVKGAEQELKVAGGYQKKTTKRKIILLLILIIVGLIIVLAIKPKRYNSNNDNNNSAG